MKADKQNDINALKAKVYDLLAEAERHQFEIQNIRQRIDAINQEIKKLSEDDKKETQR